MRRGGPVPRPVRFGDFEADFRAGELRKQGVKIKLQKQPFEVLGMLLDCPGRIVLPKAARRSWNRPSPSFPFPGVPCHALSQVPIMLTMLAECTFPKF